MRYLRVKNWEKFQHYKDRNPPWIKLHRDLLRDYNFICLQDASKLHLMLIWLLASQMDNKIPADQDFIKSQTGIKGKIDFKPLIEFGFLEDESNALAPCKQDAMPETEAETETYNICRFEEFWDAFADKRGRDAALRVWKRIKPDDALADKIIKGAKRYASERPSEKRFCKMAQGWLNDGRWDDGEPSRPKEQTYTADWWRAILGPVEPKTKFETDRRRNMPDNWNANHGPNPWKAINPNMPDAIRQEYKSWGWK